MKFGIIGAGRIGKIHGGNIAARRDCRVAFVDGRPDTAQPSAELA